MKRHLLLAIALAFGTLLSALHAQELLVYSVTGSAKVVKGKNSTPITPRQKLTMETIVSLGTGAKLVLINREEKKQYTLSEAGTFSVEKLIVKSNNSVKALSDMYLSYLMKQIGGKGVLTSKTAVDDTFASIERDVIADSIFTPTPTEPDSIQPSR